MSLTIDRALSLSQGLEDLQTPTSCAACFYSVGRELHAAEHRRSPLLEQLRDTHPEFWDACIAFVTLPRTEDDLPALRRQLFRNIRQCSRRSEHDSLFSSRAAEPLRMLFETLYVSLLCVLARGQHPMVNKPTMKMPKRFGTKRGRWPESVDKLFPHGEQQTVEMHVFWCSMRITQASFDVFGCTLLMARPLSFPHLLASKTMHAQMVYLLSQLLHGDVEAIPEGWEGTPPVNRPVDKLIPLSFPGIRHMLTEPPIRFLCIIHQGLDIKNNDYLDFFLGYERVLFSALQAASRKLDPSDELFAFASSLIEMLYTAFSMPLSDVDARVRARWPNGGESRPLGDGPVDARVYMANLVTLNLKQLSGFRGCSGPECGKTVHGNEGCPFSACANCKVVRYCSKACQQRDWKFGTEGFRHKDICPSLSRLSQRSTTAFVDAFKDSLSAEDQIRLFQWSAAGGSLFSAETTALYRKNFQRINESVGGFPNQNADALEKIIKQMVDLINTEEGVARFLAGL